MVLFVEGELASPIRGGGRGAGRSAAKVLDLDVGGEQHPAATRAHRRAQIDVLRVEEEAFVQQPDRLEIRTSNQQTRAADPIDLVRLPRHAIDRRDDRRHASIVAPRRGPSAGARPAARSSRRTTAPRVPDRRRFAVRRSPRPARASSCATSRSMAPAGTRVSGFSSSTSSRGRRRESPRLFAAAKPEIGAGLDQPHAGPRWRARIAAFRPSRRCRSPRSRARWPARARVSDRRTDVDLPREL